MLWLLAFGWSLGRLSVDWRDGFDSLGARDVTVLRLIGEEELAGFTFDGLKRRLSVHPETLSRILGRLEEHGFLEKGVEGYRVTQRVRDRLGPRRRDVTEPNLPLVQTLLSPDIPVQEVASDLMGRWFGSLRWLGYSETGDKMTLKWVTEDGGAQINAVFSGSSLVIEAKLLREKNLDNALRASYQLMGHVSKIYSRVGRIRRVAYFTGMNPFFKSG